MQENFFEKTKDLTCDRIYLWANKYVSKNWFITELMFLKELVCMLKEIEFYL